MAVEPINPPRPRWLKEFNRRIPRVLEALIQEFDPEKIILFGSWARGDFRERSDVDLMVITKTELRYLDRIQAALAAMPEEELIRYRFDILIYTPEEFEELRKTRKFVARACREGKVLYERE